MRARYFVAFVGLALHAAAAWAVGESPTNPIDLPSGGQAISVSVNRPGQTVWLRSAFAPSAQHSHLILETLGAEDTVIELYRSVEDARAGRPLADDDDSGEALNARLSYALGYPSPLLASVRLFSGSRTGRFQARFQRELREPESCPSSGPCAVAVAAEGRPSAARLLRVLRNIKHDLLLRTPRGSEIVDLYYVASRELLPELILTTDLRQELLAELGRVLPLLEEMSRAGVHQERGERIQAAHVEAVRTLFYLLSNHVGSDTAARLAQLWSEMDLEASVGETVSSALLERALLPLEESPWTLTPDLYPVKKREVVLRLASHASSAQKPGLGPLKTGSAGIDRILDRYRLRTVKGLLPPEKSSGDLGSVLLVSLEDDADVEAMLRELRASEETEYATRNGRAYALSEDVYFRYQYGLDNAADPRADVNAPEGWEYTRGEPSTLVAVVDTGVDYHQADLVGKVRVDLGYDFGNDDADARDDQGHGSHVAGIVAATADNRYAVAGVAPGVSIVPMKVLDDDGSGSWSDVAAGIVASADAGARIINLSLGGPGPERAVEDSLAYAVSRGALPIAASGNDGAAELSYPASSPHAFAVGATDDQNRLATFSNTGNGLDLVAPGVEIVSLFRDGQICVASGTSMATPHVAGVAALLLSQDPTLTVAQLRDRLQRGALDLGARGYDTTFGWGLVNAAGSLALGAGTPTRSCVPGPTTLCLQGNRFQVTVSYRANGQSGNGSMVPLSALSGLVYFFNPDNVEMLAKLIDGCALNNRFWFFLAATTNLEYTVRVVDTVTGRSKQYVNRAGTTAVPVQDTAAFACN